MSDKPSPDIINDIKPYHDHGMGIPIKSRAHRKEEMKKRGLEEIGDDLDYVRNQPTEIDPDIEDIPVEIVERVMADVERGVDPDVASAEARDALNRR